MRHVGQGPELLLEAEDGRGIVPLQGLQGHRHAALLVERPVDDSHATTAQLAFDAIATQPLRAAGSSGGFAAGVRVVCAVHRLVERGLGRLAQLQVQKHVEDPLGVLRASGRVLGGHGLLAQAAARVEFRGQEVVEQSRAVRLGDLAEDLLDPRRLTHLPRRLESVTDPVDLVEYGQGQSGAIGCSLGAHHAISFSASQLLRINSTLRAMVRRLHPS